MMCGKELVAAFDHKRVAKNCSPSFKEIFSVSQKTDTNYRLYLSFTSPLSRLIAIHAMDVEL